MGTAYDWSTTASSNGAADATINFAEGQLAPTLNNSSRALMARVKAWLLQQGGVASGGSSNAYTYTSPSGHAFSTLVTNSRIAFKANHTNTGAATLAVDGLTATAIRKKDGATALDAGDIQSGQIYDLVYDGTYWQLLGGIGTQQDSAVLQTLAALTDPGADRIAFWDDSADGMAWLSLGTGLAISGTTLSPSGLLVASNNLSDLGSASTGRTNLGLGTAATVNTGTSGATIPLLNGANTWSGENTFSASVPVRFSNSVAGLRQTVSGDFYLDVASGGATGNFYLRNGSGFAEHFTVTSGGDVRIFAAPSALATNSAGFRGAPMNEQNAAYELVLSDAGKTLYHSSAAAHTWTIPNDVVFPIGTVISLLNLGSGVVTIAYEPGLLLYKTGVAPATANQTLAAYTRGSLQKISNNEWLADGVA